MKGSCPKTLTVLKNKMVKFCNWSLTWVLWCAAVCCSDSPSSSSQDNSSNSLSVLSKTGGSLHIWFLPGNCLNPRKPLIQALSRESPYSMTAQVKIQSPLPSICNIYAGPSLLQNSPWNLLSLFCNCIAGQFFLYLVLLGRASAPNPPELAYRCGSV